MRVILATEDVELLECWLRFCGDLPRVELHHGSVLDLDVDAVVSPANSFGFMDGGIDSAYTRRFGRKVQDRLQRLIRERHHGELLVGAAERVPTDDARIPFVVAAPTMRVPMVLLDSVNPYLAARAALLLGTRGYGHRGRAPRPSPPRFRSMALPGLGTGVGRIPPSACARQMRRALEDVLLGKFVPPRTWDEAQGQHQLLYTNKVRDLQEAWDDRRFGFGT